MAQLMRVRAGLQALDAGIPKDYPEYVLHQMVTVMRGGEEVKISKRAGSYVTLRDLIDEVGRDATRYFLIARKSDSQMAFDIDLARSQSNDNPVSLHPVRACARVQRAASAERARIALESRQWSGQSRPARQRTRDRADGRDRALRRSRRSGDDESRTASDRAIPGARELRTRRSDTYYNAHQFIVDDTDLRDARIALAAAARQVLANGLDLLGVSAPESM